MDQQVKEQWLKALRSGEYQQTSCVLNNGKGGFCCLGVLSDLYAKENGIEWAPPSNSYKTGLIMLGADAYPAYEILDWSRFPVNSNIPDIKDRDDKPLFLTDLNDSGQLNFNQIADIIEYFF